MAFSPCALCAQLLATLSIGSSELFTDLSRRIGTIEIPVKVGKDGAQNSNETCSIWIVYVKKSHHPIVNITLKSNLPQILI